MKPTISAVLWRLILRVNSNCIFAGGYLFQSHLFDELQIPSVTEFGFHDFENGLASFEPFARASFAQKIAVFLQRLGGMEHLFAVVADGRLQLQKYWLFKTKFKRHLQCQTDFKPIVIHMLDNRTQRFVRLSITLFSVLQVVSIHFFTGILFQKIVGWKRRLIENGQTKTYGKVIYNKTFEKRERNEGRWKKRTLENKQFNKNWHSKIDSQKIVYIKKAYKKVFKNQQVEKNIPDLVA